MINRLLITILLCGYSAVLSGQIKIGDNPQNIDAASVLELESTERVLVITRVNTGQMNAIIPNHGALVYNTDVQCIFYYDGAMWQNLCASQGLTLTTNAIENTYQTITITENGNQRNIEVLEIRGENIADASITAADLQADSVGSAELQDNSVSDNEINYNDVTLGDFTNDIGFITSAQVVSGNAGNDIIDNGGAFYDDAALQNDIANNTAAIAADGDTDPTNELQNLNTSGFILGITGGSSVDLSFLNDPGTDDQNLSLTGNVIDIEDGNSIDLTPILGGGGTDDQQLTLGGNTLTLEDGGTVDLSGYLDNTDDQNLSLTGNVINIEDGNSIDLTPILGGGGNPTDELNITFAVNAGNLEITDAGGTLTVPLTAIDTDDQTAAEVSYDNTTSGLTAIETQAAIDELAAAGGGNPTDELNTAFAVNAGNLEITDAGGILGVPISSIDTDDQTAAEVSYDNTISGLIAADTQAAIDEIAAGAVDTNTTNISLAEDGTDLTLTDSDGNSVSIPLDDIDDQTAAEVTYDNASSGLLATDTQAAIDEIVATSLAPHTGGLGAVYFADATGAPLTNDDSFFWDETARVGTGGLFIGVDGGLGIVESNIAKVQIVEQVPTEVAYPLHLQNRDGNQNPANDDRGSAVGLLLAVDALEGFGKGAIAYQRRMGWARGDFHILQNTSADNSTPTLADAAVTVTNAGDVGIGTTTPVSTLELSGSFAAPIRDAPAGAVNNDDHTVVFNTIVTVSLPTAASSTGRIYVLKNVTGVALTIDNYLDSQGISSIALPTGVTWLQSDGVDWQAIN